MVFGELNEEEKALLEEKLIECYEEKGINFNDKTLYKTEIEKINIKMQICVFLEQVVLENLFILNY